MYQNPKSATTAGLLGIFLGGFGAHNWYLGEKGKGIAHVCMMGAGFLVWLLANIVLPNALSFSALLTMAGMLTVLAGIASIAMSASSIWGLVEGIIILSQGDAGLAAKGYPVATPVMQNQNMNYGPQGYAQPMNNQMGGQPMNGQPMYGQPMGQMPQQPMNNQPMQGDQGGMNTGNWGNADGGQNGQ